METAHLMFLRIILKAPKSARKEMLYLEMKYIPFRDLIRKRRLSFLYYIFHEYSDSLVQKYLEIQRSNRTKQDWVTTVFKYMDDLNINQDNEVRRI